MITKEYIKSIDKSETVLSRYLYSILDSASPAALARIGRLTQEEVALRDPRLESPRAILLADYAARRFAAMALASVGLRNCSRVLGEHPSLILLSSISSLQVICRDFSVATLDLVNLKMAAEGTRHFNHASKALSNAKGAVNNAFCKYLALAGSSAGMCAFYTAKLSEKVWDDVVESIDGVTAIK
jgi:hypothetical protein